MLSGRENNTLLMSYMITHPNIPFTPLSQILQDLIYMCKFLSVFSIVTFIIITLKKAYEENQSCHVVVDSSLEKKISKLQNKLNRFSAYVLKSNINHKDDHALIVKSTCNLSASLAEIETNLQIEVDCLSTSLTELEMKLTSNLSKDEIYEEMYPVTSLQELSKYIDSPIFNNNGKYTNDEREHRMYDLLLEIQPPDIDLFTKSGGLTKKTVINAYMGLTKYDVNTSLMYTEMFRNGWDLVTGYQCTKPASEWDSIIHSSNGQSNKSSGMFMFLVKREHVKKNVFIVRKYEYKETQQPHPHEVKKEYIFPKINSTINNTPCYRW